MKKTDLNFRSLVNALVNIHNQTKLNAAKAINISLTVRNWMMGYYIREYEMGGTDRAKYGKKLLQTLSKELVSHSLKRMSERELRRYRLFYDTYPQIREALTPEFRSLLPTQKPQVENRESPTPETLLNGKVILQNLSFTHIAELITIDSPLKRIFYEVECIRGNWSVRELKRQINSLYFERSGLSKDKKALANHINSLAHKASLPVTVQDPYVFEFLGLKPISIVLESDLETALLDRLQEFMLELGHGFCFEKRQKRILIGDEYFFFDLVFYHRILKCHVLIELKVDAFKHEYLGQLNTYLNWFRKHEMAEEDNPPIGLLLCTEKNQALVKYAKTGINNQLYVSKYQLELPQKEDLRKFIESQVKELDHESLEKYSKII
jgi:predicted nuclease of restriction endonuclease-like (RecB) superfamily